MGFLCMNSNPVLQVIDLRNRQTFRRRRFCSPCRGKAKPADVNCQSLDRSTKFALLSPTVCNSRPQIMK